MANYYIAPESSFDATADAIRAKTGSSASIEWTQTGFADAVAAIQTGISLDVYASHAVSGNVILSSATTIRDYAFSDSSITSISSTSATSASQYCFARCTSLLSVDLPNIQTVSDVSAIGWFDGCSSLTSLYLPKINRVWNYMFRNCTSLTTLVLPSLTQLARPNSIDGDIMLKVIDWGGGNSSNPNGIANNWFKNCASFDTLILRYSVLVTLSNVGAFTGTPFDSGGTGGTIYIPKAFYDHLGDGSSLDYQSATNWSTLHGYGTITWAKIEGSVYETKYADGSDVFQWPTIGVPWNSIIATQAPNKVWVGTQNWARAYYDFRVGERFDPVRSYDWPWFKIPANASVKLVMKDLQRKDGTSDVVNVDLQLVFMDDTIQSFNTTLVSGAEPTTKYITFTTSTEMPVKTIRTYTYSTSRNFYHEVELYVDDVRWI